MLAQLSRRVRSSSTMRIWTLALAAGVSESGSVMAWGWVGLSGLEPAESAGTSERIAVVSISRPCKGPPHGEVDRAICDLAHTTCRRCHAGIGPIDRPRPPHAGTAFTTARAGCQGWLLLKWNSFYRENGAV